MSKRFRTLIVFIGALAIADILTSRIIEHYYRRVPGGSISEINYVVHRAKEDVIVMGSSRARHHYVSSVLADSIRMSVYNAGMNGKSIYYHAGILQSLIARHAPRVVILDVTEKDLIQSADFDLTQLNSLYPYYGINAKVDSILVGNQWSNWVKLQSGLYRYNSKLSDIIGGFRNRNEQSSNGYLPMKGNRRKELLKSRLAHYNIDSGKLRTLDYFMETTKRAGIQLIVVVSPSYESYEKEVELFAYLKDKLEARNVPFLQLGQDTYFLAHPDLFYDKGHLNHLGALRFTSKLGEILKRDTLILSR